MKISAITITLGILISSISQMGPQLDSFEKQALAAVQRMPAFELDTELPKSPFGDWFKQLVGPQAGLIWQLTECGDPISLPNEAKQDLPACAEANAVLPNGRKVIVAIMVGTFKKGFKGQPAFFRAVIDHQDRLNQVRRLHDLPEILRAPESLHPNILPNTGPNTRPNIRPATPAEAPPPKLIPYITNLSWLTRDTNPVWASQMEVEAPPPPQTKPEGPQKVEESILLGNAISKVMPVYPANARSMNAYGKVEVEVTVSEAGVVIEAKAISGHPALRNPAVDAARKWVFKPSTFNGDPVKVRSVLTFVFAPRTQ